MVDWDTGSNVYIRPNNLWRPGDLTGGHKHNFDHTTIVLDGAVHVKATLPNGTVREFDFGDNMPNGNHFLVCADTEHEISHIPGPAAPHVEALAQAAEAAGLTEAVAAFRKAQAELPVRYWCVYAHRTPQGEIVQYNPGWPDSHE